MENRIAETVKPIKACVQPQDTATDADTESSGSSLRKVVAELRQRRVSRAAVTYVLIMWLNLQIGDVMFPMLGLPEWTLKLIIILGAMGFPAVLLLAWVFQVTHHGIVIDHSNTGVENDSRPLDMLINSLLLLFSVVLTILLITQFMVDREARDVLPGLVIESVTINAIENDGDAEKFAQRVENNLVHQLINLPGTLVRLDTKSHGVKPGIAITGSISFVEEGLHTLVNVIDRQGHYLTSVAFKTPDPEKDTAATDLAAKILAALKPDLNTQRSSNLDSD